jgi:beta-1,3-glucuronyltransferase
MWPVGLFSKVGMSSPVVVNGIFLGFYDGWMEGRKFPVDMAGFAVSVEFLLEVTQDCFLFQFVIMY